MRITYLKGIRGERMLRAARDYAVDDDELCRMAQQLTQHPASRPSATSERDQLRRRLAAVPLSADEVQGWDVTVRRCSHCLRVTPDDYCKCLNCGSQRGIWQEKSVAPASDRPVTGMVDETPMGSARGATEGDQPGASATAEALPINAFRSNYESQGVIHKDPVRRLDSPEGGSRPVVQGSLRERSEGAGASCSTRSCSPPCDGDTEWHRRRPRYSFP